MGNVETKGKSKATSVEGSLKWLKTVVRMETSLGGGDVLSIAMKKEIVENIHSIMLHRDDIIQFSRIQAIRPIVSPYILGNNLVCSFLIM